MFTPCVTCHRFHSEFAGNIYIVYMLYTPKNSIHFIHSPQHNETARMQKLSLKHLYWILVKQNRNQVHK